MKRSSVTSALTLVVSLTFCFLLLGGAASAQIQGWIDSKNGDTFASWNNTNLIIGGWAVSLTDGKPVASVHILIDNKEVGRVVPSLARADLANSYGIAYLYCGWSYSYNAGANLAPGAHLLTVMAYDSSGSSALSIWSGSPYLTIPTPQPPLGYLDQISATTVTQSQNIVVSGWAYDPQDGSPIKNVQILLDGKAVGNATLGGARPDLPSYGNAVWKFTYSAAKLGGSHTFTAIASDNEGLSTTLPVWNSQNAFNVLASDLVETAVAVSGTPVAGGTLQVTDTVKNQGNADASASYTQFFLSSNGTTKGTFLGYRNPISLVIGATETKTIPVTLPSNIAGNYFVIVCANGNNAFTEISNTNNCTSSAQIAVAGANLTESVSLNRSTALPGSAIVVTDTLANQGVVAANSSYTQIWLSSNGTTKGTFLGYRYPAGLAASTSAAPVSTTVTLPTSITTGTNYVMVCANANNAVVESTYTDDCASAPVNVLSALGTVLVDPTGTNSVSCGLAASPCKTINYAINTAATVKTITVLINPGTYVEQVILNKSLTLVSTVKYGAVIQAPTTLTLDSDGLANIVRIGGGVTAVISGLTVQGPGPSDCGSLHSGIFVADANATITDNKILSIRDTPYSGCQNGVGISISYKMGTKYFGHTDTVTSNIVLDYQKAGIVVDGLNTATVNNNTVTGQNTPGVNGQNGIEILRGAKATVLNNTVSNSAYFVACPTDTNDPNFALCNLTNTKVGPKNSSAAGILLYNVNGAVALSGNTVKGNDIGVWVSGDGPNTTNGSTNMLVSGNTIINNRAAGILVDVSSTGNKMYGNAAHSNGMDALGLITGFIDGSFLQGYGYDLVDENTNPLLNDWGYSGAPGAVPNTFDTNWGGGKGALLDY